MASQRAGEPAALSDHSYHISYPLPRSHMLHHHHHHPTTSFIRNQESPAFEFGELEEAIVLQETVIRNHDAIQPLFAAASRPSATLEMFPSWPIGFHQRLKSTQGSSKSGEDEESTDSGSALNTLSSTRLEPEPPVKAKPSSSSSAAAVAFDQKQQFNHHHPQPVQPPPVVGQQQVEMDSGNDSPRTGTSQAKSAAKLNPEKTLRRLAQNREAARKSRLRKKVYVQQLETSRVRLSQIEQDLQRARSQGLYLGGGVASGTISSGGAIFDVEYARWLDDDLRHMSELRTALQAHLLDGDLRVIVDGYVAHYDEIFRLKGMAAKSDVFHLITGMWATPVERCYLWMGGFRPSDLIKMLIPQLDPLTEHQLVGICGLQQSSQQAEEALNQGLEQLNQSLMETIANPSMNDSMHHMIVAVGKITNLEGFVRQADNLRQQTLHQLHRLLTVRQSARCFLVIGEYYGRLRALSSLWASRPREGFMVEDSSCHSIMSDLQMVHSSHMQFSNF